MVQLETGEQETGLLNPAQPLSPAQPGHTGLPPCQASLTLVGLFIFLLCCDMGNGKDTAGRREVRQPPDHSSLAW
jgi:hypothetical protein